MRNLFLSFLLVLLASVCALASPTVAVTSPANNATVNTTFTLTATGTPDTSSVISGWQIYVDGTTVYKCSTGCTASLSQSLTVTAGTHTVIARAWDTTGAGSGFTGQISITATSSSVAVTVTAPTAASSVCSPVNVVASATATGGTVTGWAITDNNNASASLYSNPGPVSSINVNLTMAAGAQNIQVKAWNSAGGSNFVNVSFTVITSGCGGGGGGGTGTLNPTTTVSAQTGCNTSAWSGFTDQGNGDEGCHNISLMDVHNFLYSGNTTQVFPNVMLWFCLNGSPVVDWAKADHCHSHAQIGYNSADTAEIKKEADEVANLGYNGVELDWYGRRSWQNQASLNWVAELNSRTTGLGSSMTFFIMFDQSYSESTSCGGTGWSTLGYASITACLEGEINADMDYANAHFFTSSKKFLSGGRPVVIFFLSEGGSWASNVDWASVWSNVRTHANTETNGSPLFLFENAGGFTHTQTSGAYNWISPCKMNSTGYSCDGTGTPTSWDQSGIDYFYSQAKNNSTKLAMGAAWKGFDDQFADWSSPPPNNRFLDQNCGMSWVDSMSEPNKYYSTTTQLATLLIPTWSDYEEGTEVESGVNNCYTISSSLSGTTLNWTLNGSGSANTGTVDHFTVYASTDGVNLAVVQDNVAAATRSLNMANYALPGGTYSLYVKLVSKPEIRTEMSSAVSYTSTASTASAPTAAVTLSPTSGTAPVTVTADGSTSVAGSGQVLSKMVIQWGDGSANTTLTASPWTATHSYSGAGTFIVTNTVTNGAGLTSSATATEAVGAPGSSSGAVLNSQLTNGAYVYSPLRVQGTLTVAIGPISHARIIVDGATIFDQAETGTTYNLDKYVFLSGGSWHTIKAEVVDGANGTVYDSQTVTVFCVGHSN